MDLAVGQNERRWREWGIRNGLAASGGNGEFEMRNGGSALILTRGLRFSILHSQFFISSAMHGERRRREC